MNIGRIKSALTNYFQSNKYSLILFYAGIWFVITIFITGKVDIYRMQMPAYKNEISTYAVDKNYNSYKMPFSIELLDFRLDEYPPDLYFMESENSGMTVRKKYNLNQYKIGSAFFNKPWYIRVEKYLPQSVKTLSGLYLPDTGFGSVPAVLLLAVNLKDHHTVTGWVSGSSYYNTAEVLKLNPGILICLSNYYPKKITSVIKLFLQDGSERTLKVSNNHDGKFLNWRIQLKDFDESMGNMSDYVSLEWVYNPWQATLQIFLLVTLIGLIGLIYTHWNKFV